MLYRVFQDLKKMKEKDADREREEWAKEVLSDKNPNLVEYYKEKLEEKKLQVLLAIKVCFNYIDLSS